MIESSDRLIKNGNQYEIKGYGKVLLCAVPNSNMLFICSRGKSGKAGLLIPYLAQSETNYSDRFERTTHHFN